MIKLCYVWLLIQFISHGSELFAGSCCCKPQILHPQSSQQRSQREESVTTIVHEADQTNSQPSRQMDGDRSGNRLQEQKAAAIAAARSGHHPEIKGKADQ